MMRRLPRVSVFTAVGISCFLPWLALLERVETPYPKLGDSTGKLEQLS